MPALPGVALDFLDRGQLPIHQQPVVDLLTFQPALADGGDVVGDLPLTDRVLSLDPAGDLALGHAPSEAATLDGRADAPRNAIRKLAGAGAGYEGEDVGHQGRTARAALRVG